MHPSPLSSIHLHPAALSSIHLHQLISTSTQFHPAYFSLHRAICNTLNVISANQFLGKFGPKKSKVSVFLDNLHKWYLEDADSYFNISFLIFETKIHFWVNLGQKSQSCLSCLKIGTHGILRMWILIPTLVL